MRIQVGTYTNADDGLEARIYFHGGGQAFPYTVELWDTDAKEKALEKKLNKLERAQAFGRAFCGENYSIEV
jgi:hypothetical protein